MSDGPEILDNLLVKARRSFEAAESFARYHRLLIEALGLRQAADYSATPETVSEEDADYAIKEGKQCLAAAREYLERQ
jgi:hypothetical protein